MKEKLEPIVSLTAIATAVVAVVVAIAQTRLMSKESTLMREHQRLSVTPSVWITRGMRSDIDGGRFNYVVHNRGLGPAVVEDFTVRHRDEPMADWNAVFASVAGSEDSVASVRNSLAPGHVIPAGERVEILRLSQAPDAAFALYRAGDELEISVCACSFYRECWRTVGLQSRPVAVEACPASPVYFDSANW